MYALPRVAGEIVRLCPEASRAGAIVTVSLTDAPGAVSRARGVALYRVGVAFSWRADLGVVGLCDTSADPVEWRFSQVADWLELALGGWPVTVAIEFNAGRLAAPYVGRRLDRHEAYMAALVPSEWRTEAAAMRARWVHQRVDAVRRVQADARALVLEGMADALDLIRASAGGFP